MRDKEAIENERKNLLRNLEKQAKLVEKLLAVEKSMQGQLVRDSTVLFLDAQAELLLDRTRPDRPSDARSNRHTHCKPAKAHD